MVVGHLDRVMVTVLLQTLASLDSWQQAPPLGHAVPITIRACDDGPELVAAVKARACLSTAATPSERRAETASLF